MGGSNAVPSAANSKTNALSIRMGNREIIDASMIVHEHIFFMKKKKIIIFI